jgi:hypothetical protein
MDEASLKDIAAEYKEVRGLGLCEEEFATFAPSFGVSGDQLRFLRTNSGA